jgi:transposase-like protein
MRPFRSYTLAFKQDIVQQYLSGACSILRLAKQHDVAPSLIKTWIDKYRAGKLDTERGDTKALDGYETRIAELERKVGQLTMENDFLKRTRARLVSQNGAKPSVTSGPRNSRSDERANS